MGPVRECWEYIPASYTEGPVEHFMKSAEDLPLMKHIYENSRFEPDYDFAHIRKEQVGDQGVVLCYTPKSPFMHLLALEAGIMSVTMTAMTQPDEFQELLEVMKKAFDQAAQIAVDSPAEVLMIPENLSSEMVGPEFFEAYMRAYQEEWTTKISQAGKYSYIHIDGTLKGLLKQEASVGFSVLEALTPHPVGDLKWEELASYAAPSFSDDRPFFSCVRDLTQRIFEDFTYDPRFTDVATPLAEVLQHRRGVCQDFAHLAIGCLRSLGYPARYVSGYLETQPPPGAPRLEGADASHAWFSAYSPVEGWAEGSV